MSVTELIKHINDLELIDALSEVKKLAELLCKIPYSTASLERSFSALKRIKTFNRNTMGEERLSSLRLLSIEKELLSHLQSSPSFYDNVIENFDSMCDRRIVLTYK